MPAPLDAAGSVTFAGTGGSVTIGPVPTGERWHVARITLRAVDSAGNLSRPVPKVTVARGLATIDSSRVGDDNVSDFPTPMVLHPGETIVCTWTDATAGDVGRFTVLGTREAR